MFVLDWILEYVCCAHHRWFVFGSLLSYRRQDKIIDVRNSEATSAMAHGSHQRIKQLKYNKEELSWTWLERTIEITLTLWKQKH
jgi:hypothetical protein